MIDVIEPLKTAADGAFVVDEDLRIHTWNNSAEEILGINNNDALGRLCYQLLQGQDEERRQICKAYCKVAQLALKAKPVPNYDMRVRTKQEEGRWLNMSIITTKLGENGSTKRMIVHLFRDISQKKADEKLFRQIMETAQRYPKIPAKVDDREEPSILAEKLTVRERDVLALLASGQNTQEIADSLFITPNTVRNHVQRILQKLQVHSRLEAVTFSIKNGLNDAPALRK